jgi:hypothetical protein
MVVRQQWGVATMGISRKVALFNLAYKLARERVEKEGLKNSHNSQNLNRAIRKLIHAGATDAVTIAAEAIKVISNEPTTPR